MATDQLLYPRPRASDFHVHRLLHDIQEDEALFVKFLEDPDSVLSNYPEVSAEDKRIIAAHDYSALLARGIHPVMIVQFQRHIEWGMRMTADRDAAVSVTDARS